MALRLLLVDDNAHFLRAARTLLEREGMRVVAVASTSAEAVRLARELRPDVTLLDIDLGSESGFDVAHSLVHATDAAAGSAVPVELDVRVDRRLPGPVEVAAYYVVSEALTNVAKHAEASQVRVDVDAPDSLVRLAVHDDGAGGADPEAGTGLIGLRDRVEAVGGRMQVDSPPGGGTSLLVTIPIDSA